MKKRFTIVFGLILASITSSYAQAPAVQWQKSIGGNKIDQLYSIQQTPDGGYILGGSSNSDIAGDRTVAPCTTNGYDYWIVKLDATGNIQWQQSIGGSTSDIANSIVPTADGGYFVGGYSGVGGVSCQKSMPGSGIADWWALKLDANGNITWQTVIGGSYNDFLNSVRQTTDGGYILGGSTRSNITGNKTVPICGNSAGDVISDFWAVKLDASGNIQWEGDYGGNVTGGSGDDDIYAIRQTSDGGYIMGGPSNSGASCTKTSAGFGSMDYWIVKTDLNGVEQWQQDYGGSGLDVLNDIEQTCDGGYIIGGPSTSSNDGNKTVAGNGGEDYWVIKTDNLGNPLWQQDLGGTGTDILNSVQQTSDGGYIVGGFSNSPISGNKTVSPLTSGQYDYWIVKLDPAGNILWQDDLGKVDSNAMMYQLQQTSDNGYILGGTTNSSTASIDTSGKVRGSSTGSSNTMGTYFGSPNPSASEFWVVKLAPDNGTAAAASHLDSVCLGKVDTLFGIPQSSFTWEVLPGGSGAGSLSCTTCVDPVVSPTQTTTYVEVSPTAACNDTVKVVVLPLPATQPIDTLICAGDAVQLNIHLTDTTTGSSPTVVWSPATYLSNPSVSNPVCTPLNSITYLVTVSYVNACESIDTVNITSPTAAPEVAFDTILCKNDVVQLNIPAPVSAGIAPTIVWSPATYLNNSTISNPVSAPSSTISYIATVSYDGQCTTLDPVTIYLSSIVKPAPLDTAICQNIAAPLLNVVGDSLSWYSPSGILLSQYSQPIISTQDVVLDTFNIQNLCGEATVNVRIINYPFAILGNDTVVCNGQAIPLNITPQDNVHYAWSTGDSTCCISVTETGNYVVQVSDVCGMATDSEALTFYPCNTCLFVPNAFSPNNDGKNDHFDVVDRCGISSYHIIIVNRYGQMVYDSFDISHGWDGTFNGQPVDVGTYFYHIIANPPIPGPGGTQLSLKGDVTVVR